MTKRRRIPTYRLHEASGQARVTIRGETHYLGKYGTKESRAKYAKLLREHELEVSSPVPVRPSPSAAESDITIAELALAYINHAETYYVKGGKRSSENGVIRAALKPLLNQFATMPARDFGPKRLKELRDSYVALGWSRNGVNSQVGRIRRMFRWAVEEELLGPNVHLALAAVRGLSRGRTEAPDRARIVPVDNASIEDTLPHLPPIVADMVRVQRLSGMRSGEVVLMRAIDIDRSDAACWVYVPPSHKTAHRDVERVIYLGPRAIAILRPYIVSTPDGYLFDPRRTEAEKNLRRRGSRTMKLWPSHAKRLATGKPNGRSRECYTSASYRRAITRACKRAGVAHWHPHQLRHSASTEIRKRFGLEAAQGVLGHTELETTQIYAQRNMDAARAVMREIG